MADSTQLEEPWGQLVVIEGKADVDRFPFSCAEIQIGRGKGNDLAFPGNKFLSGRHCKVYKDVHGRVYLRDTSSNGTSVDGRRINGQSIPLNDGSIIKLVFQRNNTESNVSLRFCDLRPRDQRPGDQRPGDQRPGDQRPRDQRPGDQRPGDQKPGDQRPGDQRPGDQRPGDQRPVTGSVESNETVECEQRETVSATTQQDEEGTTSLPSKSKRQPIESVTDSLAKRSNLDDTSNVTPTVELVARQSSNEVSSGSGPTVSSGSGPAVSSGSGPAVSSGSGPAVSSGSGPTISSGSGPAVSSGSGPTISSGSGPTVSSGSGPAVKPSDDMGDNLLCGICQEVFHDCISLQPCMHSFCAGCYSGWMDQSNHCPECRNKVDRISKNHRVNNVVEAYLKMHPEKRRPGEDLKELDEKNKITREILYPKRKRRHYDDDEDDDDDDDDNDDDDDEEDLDHWLAPSLYPNFPLLSHLHHPLVAPRTVCRQCPARVPPAGTSVEEPSSAVPTYTCPDQSVHVTCQCCYLPMPHRTDPNVPPQRCSLCLRTFCHMYWRCSRSGCLGCLNRYKDIQLDHSVLSNLLPSNTYESTILKDYVLSRGETINDVLTAILEKVDDSTYSLNDSLGRPIHSDTVTCQDCAVKYLKEAAYFYRRDIPNNDLPSSVTSRPDCHWGRHCRTQRHNPEHARRYNHICEQTRFV